MPIKAPNVDISAFSNLTQQSQERSGSLIHAAWARLGELNQAQQAVPEGAVNPLFQGGMSDGEYAQALGAWSQSQPQGQFQGQSQGQAQPGSAAGSDAAAIRAGLIQRGMPEHIADGFIMNFRDESGFNPGINEASPLVPGSRGGFGLYQVTGPRRRQYEAFAQSRNVGFDNVDAQLDFLMHELRTTESSAAQKIFATQNAGQAGAAIVQNFLRPAEEHRIARVARYTGQPAPQRQAQQPMQIVNSSPWLSFGQPVAS
jgi:hypothetical protein